MEIKVKEQNEQPTLSIRTKTSLKELPSIIGESYCKIMDCMRKTGEQPVDAPFTAYHNLDLETMNMDHMDVEMGFPIAKEVPGEGEVFAGKIPAGTVVTTMYKGPYNGMEGVYGEIFAWIAEQKYVPSGVYYEYYYNSPAEVPESELLTRIDIPVLKKS